MQEPKILVFQTLFFSARMLRRHEFLCIFQVAQELSVSYWVPNYGHLRSGHLGEFQDGLPVACLCEEAFPHAFCQRSTENRKAVVAESPAEAQASRAARRMMVFMRKASWYDGNMY